MQNVTSTAITTEIIGAIVGIAFTGLAAWIWPTPWTFGQAMTGVGVASFFAAASPTWSILRQRAAGR